MKRAAKAGRVIRRYKRGIAIEDFNKWQDRIRRSARGCGLYALYRQEAPNLCRLGHREYPNAHQEASRERHSVHSLFSFSRYWLKSHDSRTTYP